MSHFCVIALCEYPSEIEYILEPFQENNMGDCPKEYLEFVEDDNCDTDEETGKRGYWENPNAKWDWWEIGGRWKGFLNTKDGKQVNYAQIKDINFSSPPTQEQISNRKRIWEIAVEGAEMSEDEFYGIIYSKEYYVDRWGTKEKYVEELGKLIPWAYISPDREWNDIGNMGWWGFSDETKESRENFIKKWEKAISEIPEDYYAVVVDCHI